MELLLVELSHYIGSMVLYDFTLIILNIIFQIEIANTIVEPAAIIPLLMVEIVTKTITNRDTLNKKVETIDIDDFIIKSAYVE